MKQLTHTFEDIISLDNLLLAWQEFIVDKKKKPDVQEFAYNLMDNLAFLHEELKNGIYHHSGYTQFTITDPKHRLIHKTCVRDRILNHALHRILYPYFSKIFVVDSFSCQLGKGTHRALNRFRDFSRKASRNNTRTVWVLKGDIRKFFATIDQEILLEILAKYIPKSPANSHLRGAYTRQSSPVDNIDQARLLHQQAGSQMSVGLNLADDKTTMQLLRTIIKSFELQSGKGLPLGNLTSQLFVNIYMNEFDQFVKHWLRAQYYIRYADDFIIMSADRNIVEAYVPLMRSFLEHRLRLQLHPKKLFIKTLASGVDFLGWIHFPHHRVLRTTTKKRMMRRLIEHPSEASINSYVGLLRHGNAFGLSRQIRRVIDYK